MINVTFYKGMDNGHGSTVPGNVVVDSLGSAGVDHGHVVVDEQLRDDALLRFRRTSWQAWVCRSLILQILLGACNYITVTKR